MNIFLVMSTLVLTSGSSLGVHSNGDGHQTQIARDVATQTEGGQQIVATLTGELSSLCNSATDFLRQLDSTLSKLEPAVHHAVNKRQTSIDASVEDGPYGPRGSVGVSHQGSSGNYGVGMSHDKSGTSVHGSYDKTFNNGHSKISVSGGHTSNGDKYGRIEFSHQFGR